MIKRDALDNWFSLCIRERSNWTCESTQLVFDEGQIKGKCQGLECCHIYGRRNKTVRWNGMNAVALTHYQHRFFTENPPHFIAWLNNYLGEGHMELLRERVNDSRIKYSKADKKEMSEHYRTEYRRLRKLRDDGVTGYLEFVNYD